MQELSSQHKSLHSHDLEAMVLAEDENAPLLTRDGPLRRVCNDRGIHVFGTIWLVGEMLQSELITVDSAEEAYRLMKEDGSRLPWKEVEKQLKPYRNLQTESCQD